MADFKGGFLLKPVTNEEEAAELNDGMKRLQLSSSPRRTRPRSYSPLADVPVDSYTSQSGLSSAASSKHPNWPLNKTTKMLVNSTTPTQEVSEQGDGRPGRGRPRTPKSSHSKAMLRGPHGEAQPAKDTLYSVINRPRKARPLLSHLFGEVQTTSKGVQAETGDEIPDGLVQNGTDDTQEEYELLTVRLPKNKQSLGK